MTHLQPIKYFVPASQTNSKCVSRNAAILLLNLNKSLTGRKLKIIMRKNNASIRLTFHNLNLKSDLKTVEHIISRFTLKIDIFCIEMY